MKQHQQLFIFSAILILAPSLVCGAATLHVQRELEETDRTERFSNAEIAEIRSVLERLETSLEDEEAMMNNDGEEFESSEMLEDSQTPEDSRDQSKTHYARTEATEGN